MINKLYLTEKVKKEIEKGNYKKAIGMHNSYVRRAFEAVKKGKIINLTDLLASKETLIYNNHNNK
jgi:hypothetical protein